MAWILISCELPMRENRCVVYLFLCVNIVFLAGKFYGKKVEKDFFFPHTRDKGVCG